MTDTTAEGVIGWVSEWTGMDGKSCHAFHYGEQEAADNARWMKGRSFPVREALAAQPSAGAQGEVEAARSRLLKEFHKTRLTRDVMVNCDDLHTLLYATPSHPDTGDVAALREALDDAVVSLEELASAWPADHVPAQKVCVRMAHAINNGKAALSKPNAQGRVG